MICPCDFITYGFPTPEAHTVEKYSLQKDGQKKTQRSRNLTMAINGELAKGLQARRLVLIADCLSEDVMRSWRMSKECSGEWTYPFLRFARSVFMPDCSELANPTSRQPRQSQARNGGQDTSGGSEETLEWPARSAEEQYEWEEPRVTEVTRQIG